MIVAFVIIFALLACIIGEELFYLSKSAKQKKAISIALKIIAGICCLPIAFFIFMNIVWQIDSYSALKNYEKENGKLFTKLIYGRSEKGAIRALMSESDMNVVNKDGDTPLIIVTRHEYFEALKLCVEKGADVNKSDKHGRTALHTALSTSTPNKNVIKYLIEHGADVNKKDEDGFTPLICFADFYDFLDARDYFCDSALEVADILLEAGADVSAVNNDGNNAAFFIEKQINEEIEEIKEIKEYEQNPAIDIADIEKSKSYLTGKALLEKLKK